MRGEGPMMEPEPPQDGADLPRAAQLLFDATWQRAMVNDTTEAEARALRLASVAIARERRPGLHLFED